ncbi:uncharacterized protein LOC124888944 [Capsicum annuum]|uniref:uncharacterized protein LOC124888944 n=1 Tax=Capsicum annuum TaxID=4072 RepID=UPI001FB0E7DD|nr:uncharacterized protein LOC124888944 [Capsicum annuum]
MNPLEFYWSKVGEDQQLYLEEIRKITQEFQDVFLDKFFPLELRKAKVEEFINLRQGFMTVTKLMTHVHQIKSDQIKNRDRVRGNKTARYEQPIYGKNRSQGGNRPQLQSRLSMPAPSLSTAPALRGRCGRDHEGKWLWGQKSSYGCVQEAHDFRDCPHTRQGNRDVCPLAQTANAPAPVAYPTSTHSSSSSNIGGHCPNRFYALLSHQKLEDSSDVVTGMLCVFQFNVYPLLDPGSSFSYVAPLVAVKFEVSPEIVSEPILVSTPVD